MTRSLNTSLRDSLLKEDSFTYAHLVKFEKPLKTANGKSARRAKDYTYLTDGSFDVAWDDGSKDIQANSNGSQTYIANKIIKVGSTSETTEARASNIALTVSAAALSTSFTDSITITSGTITAASTDFVEAGFREGDVVRLLSGSGANDTARVRIDSFSNNNKTANITALTKISSGEEVSISALTAGDAVSYSVNFANAEVESILNNRSSTGYARYINRDVFIYKAHINKDTGAFIGDPYLLFKGIIASGKISEDPSKQSVVTWSITSHWGDFRQVSGRLTSDDFHRALDGNGNPDRDAVLRPAYAGDLGFLHSESAVNLMAIYQVSETRYREKRRGGLAGAIGLKKLEEYQVEVDREVDLRFNLDAKYLPVVYGVNKIDSIPIFVDSLNTNSKKVYVAYALCEGEIGGLYDVYLDDTNSICLDANDNDTRSSQTDNATVDVLCSGRMDRGDTLLANTVTSGTSSYGSPPSALGATDWAQFQADMAAYYSNAVIGNPNSTFGAGSSSSSAGITHEAGHGFVTPIDAKLIFHSGKPNQKADALLVSQSSNFKVRNDYYTGASDYWGAAHRLLDTAYVVVEYTVGEGETTLPSLDFVVRGKGVECYNYDFSFEQDPKYTSSDAASSAFSIGASVSITATSGGSSLGNSIIADIYNLTNLDGTTSTRIRFLEEPPLTYTDGIPSVTAFKMTSGSNIFHLVAHNNTTTSGSVARKLQDTISSDPGVSDNSSSGVDFTLSGADSKMEEALVLGTHLGISAGDESFGAEYSLPPELINTYTYSSSGSQVQGVGDTTLGKDSLEGKKAFLKDVVALASSADTQDDYYNNMFIEVTHINSDNTVKVQKRKITDYDGGEKIAKVDVPFEEDAIPDTNDTYKIFSVANDVRVSTNPAMQLLDYLTEKRYGRDLLLEDIDLSSFLQSARDCDTRSDVTVVTTAAATVGDVYSVTRNSKVLWVGTVKSSTQIESSRYNTVFTNVLGKLAHRWEDWKAFVTGEYYYYKGALHQASANDTISNPGTTASISSYALSKDSGSGPSSLSLEVSKATSTEGGAGNPVVKVGSTTSSSSGYSLYDADDVKYWRYMGWEAQNQRHVTRHQTNAVINTAKPVFDNVNSMLSHFNGILRYSDGKYSLAIKTASSDPTTITVDGSSYTLGDISDEDIIGQINVEDSGQKGTYNQVSLTINDPQNRFEGRSVVLSNSDYLKEDRRVPKKGSSTTPYVTNYFNARLNAKQYLDDSRAGLKISFTLGPKGLLLRAGDIIRITYSRFGWANKLYRVKNLNFQENCLVQVTAEEHNDDGYLIQPKRSNVILPAEPSVANMAAPAAPSDSPSLSTNATDNRGGIILSWTNTSTFNAATYTVQIYRHTSNDRSNAKLVGLSKGDNFTDSITGAGEQTFYYWIRYSVNVPLQRTTGVAPREIFSAYFPTSATGGIAGTAASSIDGASINFAFVRVPHGTTASDVVASATGTQATPANFTVSSVSYTWSDTIPSGTGTLYTVKGSKTPPATGFVWGTPRQLEGDSHAELIIYSDVVASGGSAPADPTACTYNFTTGVLTIAGTNASSWNKIPPSLASAADGSQIFAITVVVSGAPGDTAAAIAAGDWSTDFVYSRYVKGAPGAAGVDAYSVSLTASKYAIAYNIDGGESDTLVFTAAPQGVTGTATYKFEVDGTEKQAAGSATQYTMADSDEPTAGAAKVVKVTLFDDGTEKATDSVSIYGIQDGEDAITVIMTNEAHALPTTAAGAISYTNSGTDIKVFRGSTALNYGSSANQFEVSAAGSNITPNASPSGTGTTRSYGVASACTAATATITFTVTVKNALGTATSFTKIQTFNKTTDGTPAKGLSLILGANTIAFDNSRGNAVLTPSGSTQDIAVSTNLQNITGTPELRINTSADLYQSDVQFVGDDHILDATSATIDASSWGTVSLGQSVLVKASLTFDGVTYTDTQSVHAVFSGEDAVTGYLTNENFTAPTAEGGNPVLTGGTGNMKIFLGATEDTSNWTFTGTATSNGLTCTVTQATGAYALSGTWTGTTESFDITASRGGYTNVVKTFTVAKTADGATGEGNEVIYYVSKSAPDTPTASAANSLDTGWSTAVPTATENVWVSLGSRAAGVTNYTWGAPKLLQEVTSNILLNQNMLPWVVGTGDATVPGGTWSKNGTTSENTQSLLTDAFGGQSVIWRAINGGTDNYTDGGFNGPLVAISPLQEYRFSILANQKHSNDGTTYFGLRGYDSSSQLVNLEKNDGSGNTSQGNNPYFFSGDLPALDQWYLIVGHLVPHNDSDETIHPDSGIWSVATGKKVAALNHNDWKFQSTHTQALIRAYQYYNTSSDADEVQFFAPRIDIADERMPSIQDLLRTAAAGDDAKVVVVTPSTPFFVKSFSAESGGGITTTPASITITAATSNTTTNGAWSTSAGTLTSIDNSHASPSCVVTSANAVDGMTVTYTLHSDDGGSADSTTLEILDSQDNQITPHLTNEAHVYPASKTGAVSVITGSGTDVQVFEGGDLLDYDGTGTATGKWKVVLDSPTGLTKGAVSSQGSTPSRFARVADHTPATGTDSYSLTHTITGKSSQGKSFSFTKVQTLTKSKTGDDGDDAVSGYLTNESFVAQTAVGGNPNLTGGTGNMKIFLGTTDDTSNWSFSGTATSNGLTCTVTAGTGAYALSGTWTGTTESFNITASRTDYDDVVKTFKVTKVSDGATGAAAYSATVNPGQIYFNEVSGSVVPDGNQLVTFTFTNGTIIHTKSFNYSTDADDNSITSTEVSGGDSEISFDSAAGLAPRTSTTDNQAVRAVHSTSGLKATAIAFYQVVKGT